MPLTRRQWLSTLTTLAAGAYWPSAQTNEGVIRLLVGFPPGGGTDALAQLLAPHLSQALGTEVIVDNRPGAGGQIAAQALKTSTPNGQTLMLSHDHTISILPKVLQQPGFNTQLDFQAVAGICTFANCIVVAAEHPAHTWAEFVTWLGRQDKPSRLAIGVPAPASTPEFLVTRLARRYGKKLQVVAYRGSAPMLEDVYAGLIRCAIGSVHDCIEQQRAGKLRILAVQGTERLKVLPEVPTLAELGIESFETLSFYGIYAPKGLAPEPIARLEQATQAVLGIASVRAQMQYWGMRVRYLDHIALEAAESAYSQTWGRIIEENGFLPTS